MTLGDSSSSIRFLRPNGDPAVRSRVEAALSTGEACWCPLIRLELWNGAAGDRDRRILRDFETVLPELAIDGEVWERAYELARRARSSGVSVPATDILIAACTRRHGAELETADADFERLAGDCACSARRGSVSADFTFSGQFRGALSSNCLILQVRHVHCMARLRRQAMSWGGAP